MPIRDISINTMCCKTVWCVVCVSMHVFVSMCKIYVFELVSVFHVSTFLVSVIKFKRLTKLGLNVFSQINNSLLWSLHGKFVGKSCISRIPSK